MLFSVVLLSALIRFGFGYPVVETDNLPTAEVKGLWSNDPIYSGLVLRHHNVHRANHSAENLDWNSTLADFAEKVAMSCVWGHNV